MEQSGELSYSNKDSKVASSKIRIVHEISLEDFIKAYLDKYAKRKINKNK